MVSGVPQGFNYRLDVFPITIPPLPERPEDNPFLVAHFVRTFAEHQGKAIEHIPGIVIIAIESYNWPATLGNCKVH